MAIGLIKMLAKNLQDIFHFVFDSLLLLCPIGGAPEVFGTVLPSIKNNNILP